MINEISQIKAERNHCVPATVEMALKYYGYENMSQQEIAQKLLEITKQDEENFICNGLILHEDTLKIFFEQNHIALKELYISYNKIYDETILEKLINYYVEKNFFLICGYNYFMMYTCGDKRANHVSVLCRAFPKEGKIEIIDPGPEGFGRKRVSSDKLWNAIKYVHDGIWCIGKK